MKNIMTSAETVDFINQYFAKEAKEKPVEPVEPVKPVTPVEPVKPVEPVVPVAPVKPVESTVTQLTAFDNKSTTLDLIQMTSSQMEKVGESILKSLGLDFHSFTSSINEDTDGVVSDILCSIESQLNVSVLPMEIDSSTRYITHLPHHDILEYKGHRYSSNQVSRASTIKSWAARLKEELVLNGFANVNLKAVIEYKGVQWETLALSVNELCALFSIFKDFNPKLINDSQGDLFITLGK